MCHLERFSACFKCMQKRVPELPTIDEQGYPRTPVTPELEVQQTDPRFSRRRHSSLASCCVSGDGGTGHTHTPCLKALCLPHCFRTLHGVISAVLHYLKKKQLFHVASSTQAKPSSFSKERAMGLDLQESLA